jgi:asparagine synthase (glutamine-hydrolysing)
MCGITGLVDLSGIDRDAERRRLRSMTDIIFHRGPDEEGHFIDGHAALGHRRLSIIDCATGQQPLGNEDGSVQIVFNGEIYNFLELRDLLVAKGHQFATNSDTEAIVHLYEEFGEACVERLWGMFAFAIWDSKKRRLLLARDRVGKKPLYYARRGTRLAFGSELKSLVVGGEVAREIDLEGLDCYFTLGYVPSPRCILKDARKLRPGHYLVFDEAGMRERRYWSLSFQPGPPVSEREAGEQLADLVEQAVRCRLMSEVPLGAFLSGGIDSSLVVGQMSRVMTEPVKTNAIGFDVAAYDELPYARKVAEVCKTEHHEFTVKPDAVKVLDLLGWHFDEPLADPSAIPTYYVCKMARQQVTVALSGDGGDETFGGYTFRYRPHVVESRLRAAVPANIRGLVFGPAGSLYPKWDWLPRPLRLKTILTNLAVSDARAFYLDLSFMHPPARERLYTDSMKRQLLGFTPYEAVGPFYTGSDAPDPLGRSQHTDIQSYMTEDVLVKVDRMSMAVSLEVRCPLLDHRIMELAARLPADLRLRGDKGKWVLRQLAATMVPREVLERPKQGFTPPVPVWLRRELREMAHETLFDRGSVLGDHVSLGALRKLWDDHQSGIRQNSQVLWGMLMFRLWERNYLHGDVPPPPMGA